MAINTILFDFDGTLVDSFELIFTASRHTMEEMGLPWDEAKQKSLIGLPLVFYAPMLVGEEKASVFVETYQKYYNQYHDSLIRLFPGIKELLAYLQKSGLTLAVVTSRRKFGTELAMKVLGIGQFFAASVVADDTEEHKPHPAPALLALKKLNKQASEAIFVGDSPFDMACGRDAGIATCGVTWGMASADKLTPESPTYIVNNLQDLQKLLDFLTNAK